ncbi:MAG TPA: PBP1A family penicillin-binding protein [Pyrinomonadaceae bacterium]|nr:PBP1A family penicillin-binding protein [Pyrinomonadaceae bacterium]
MIDARLASGYLTSRPGIYAAPRTIRPGQGFSRNELLSALRRAGYVQNTVSDIWSGSFAIRDGSIEIRSRRMNESGQQEPVRVGFDSKGTITELTIAGVSLASLTLEPEALSNDLSVKAREPRTLTYSEISPLLVHAILSIEDERFFAHRGVDIFGIGRALLNNATDKRLGQGGSTITQQLVKNTYLSPERTWHRKYAEAMLAVALERRLSKEDIFALYCSEVYLGQRAGVGVRGVEQAAAVYFGKRLAELSLGEAAIIAGMIQGPMRYSPERHPEVLRERRNRVLAAMLHAGWITTEQESAAANEPIWLVAPNVENGALAPYFIDYVNRIAEEQLETSGEYQQVYTTIDLELQKIAETAVQRQLSKLDATSNNHASKPQAALVALDPQTGNVLAMVGGRDYRSSQLNRATDARRQPGSTFKPFVYAAAFEDGISPLRIFTDAPHEFSYSHNRTYRPANFGNLYSMGEVPMRTGLVKSLNVVTVDVAMQTGLARIANLAEGFGLPKPERYPSLALGVSEATPLQMAAAYATFANGGRKVTPRVIASVAEPPATHASTDDGQGSQLISPTTAYMITNTLASVVERGTARSARNAISGTAIAGKTGTSRDGWFVGYTPGLVCAVWIGFDDNSQLGLTGSEAALPAWIEFVRGAVGLRPELGGRTFECPEGIKFVEVDMDTGLLSTLMCPHRELIAVTEKFQPNLECYFHGNLPPSRETETTEPMIEGPFGRESKSRDLFFARDRGVLSGTWVQVDAIGRRTLVNDMR